MRRMMYSRVLHRTVPPTSRSNCNRRAVPNCRRDAGAGSVVRPQDSRRGYVACTERRDTRAYTSATLRRRGAVRRRASKATTTVFALVDAGMHGPRQRACQSWRSHMVWRPRAQLSAHGALNTTSPPRPGRSLAAATAADQSDALSQNRAGRQSARLPSRTESQPRIAGRDSSTGRSLTRGADA